MKKKNPLSAEENKNARNTVRRRKKSAKASVQRFLPIAEIHSDTVILKNGGIRAVLEVEALNFNLKSETEQQGIISGYESFVNTLTFPLQIVIRSTKMNIDPYIGSLRALAEKQSNELLKTQTLAYADFVERIVDLADIMQKRFYVIIPLDASAQKKTLFSKFFSWLKTDDSSAKASQRRRYFPELKSKLHERINLVRTGLNNVGLHTKQLNTSDLMKLYYNVYNARTSDEQKLPDINDLNVEKKVI